MLLWRDRIGHPGRASASFHCADDEVRRDTARRRLIHTNLYRGEVAFLLGFEELNSFTRAFHAWEGMTPARWREAERIG
jgi:AraC-like DNA-binding protein